MKVEEKLKHAKIEILIQMKLLALNNTVLEKPMWMIPILSFLLSMMGKSLEVVEQMNLG